MRTTMRTKFSLYNVVRTSSCQKLEGVTTSVAMGKGLNPASLLKITVFTFIMKKKKKKKKRNCKMKLSGVSIF